MSDGLLPASSAVGYRMTAIYTGVLQCVINLLLHCVDLISESKGGVRKQMLLG